MGSVVGLLKPGSGYVKSSLLATFNVVLGRGGRLEDSIGMVGSPCVVIMYALSGRRWRLAH